MKMKHHPRKYISRLSHVNYSKGTSTGKNPFHYVRNPLLFFLLFLLWFLPPLSCIPASVYKYYSEVDISEGKFSFITEE